MASPGKLGKTKKPSALILSILIIISTLSIYSAASIQVEAATTDTFTFGNINIGTQTNSFTTDRDASRFQLTQNGQLQTITVYYTNTGFNAKTAIYTDNNGAPSTLIAQSNSQQVTSSGWQTFTLPQTSLTPGYYWLCQVSSSPSYGKMSPTSTNSHAWKYSPFSAEYPTTFGTPAGYQNTASSIYATCTTAASINPTPSPTPTMTPSPTPTPSSSSGSTKIAISSATASSYSSTHTPNLAIDGIESTANYWGTTSANGLPQWLQLNLGTQTNINQIITHFYDRDSRTYTYNIQASTDGSTWNTIVATKTGKSIVTNTFTQTTAKYIRITITGNTAYSAAHIEEVKIYQSSNSNPVSSPTATQTPSPTPTLTPSIGNHKNNGIWTQAGSDLTQSQCTYYVQQKISEIYMQVGYWKSDSSLYYLVSSSQIQTAVTNAHTAGLKIYAWVTSQASYGVTINIGSSSLRQTAINNMVNLARNYGFDGIADDLEELQCNGYSDYVSYFNGATTALHSIGKQYFAAVVTYLATNMGSTLFSTIHVDRIQPMLYAYPSGQQETKLKEHMDFFLRYSSSPVGLAIHSDYSAYGTLADAMRWVDQKLASGTPTTKLAGIDIFWVHGMTQSQWNAWSNWNTKN
jgi:hypothetical protein